MAPSARRLRHHRQGTAPVRQLLPDRHQGLDLHPLERHRPPDRRKLSSDAYGEYTNGAISNIRIYPTALPPADAAVNGDALKITQLD
ncbi:hypothetical protein [Streptomyces sp. NPDC001635]